MLEDREEILKKLGVDRTDPNNWLPPSAAIMFPKNKARYERFLNRIHQRFELEGSKSSSRTIHVQQGFCLQERFETWFAAKGRRVFASILFRDLIAGEDVKQLLSAWTIKYEGKYRVCRAESGMLPFIVAHLCCVLCQLQCTRLCRTRQKS